MTPADATLVERLRAQAVRTSDAHRMMAEAKSLRQAGNPEGRTDLYAWVKSEDTVETQAADAITRLSADAARVGELKAALEPFAKAVDDLDEDVRDQAPLWDTPVDLDVKHLRAARAALKDHSR